MVFKKPMNFNLFHDFLKRQGSTLGCNQTLNILWACHSSCSCIDTHCESRIHIQPATLQFIIKRLFTNCFLCVRWPWLYFESQSKGPVSLTLFVKEKAPGQEGRYHNGAKRNPK